MMDYWNETFVFTRKELTRYTNAVESKVRFAAMHDDAHGTGCVMTDCDHVTAELWRQNLHLQDAAKEEARVKGEAAYWNAEEGIDQVTEEEIEEATRRWTRF